MTNVSQRARKWGKIVSSAQRRDRALASGALCTLGEISRELGEISRELGEISRELKLPSVGYRIYWICRRVIMHEKMSHFESHKYGEKSRAHSGKSRAH